MSGIVGYLQRKDRLVVLVAAAALLAAGAIAGLVYAAGWREVWDTLLHPRWLWLPIALGCEIVAYVGYMVAYREVARVEDGAEFELPHVAALVATGFGVFVAAGGFALDNEALQRAGMPEEDAKVRVLGLGALEYAILAPAAAIAAAWVLVRGTPTKPGLGLTLPWIVAVPLGFAFAIWALRFLPGLEGRKGWRTKLARALGAVDILRRLATAPRKHGLAFLGAGLYWLGDIACLWAALHMFEAEAPSIPVLVLGYATGYALTRRTLPLGGAGVVEALLPFALGWVGIALAPALVAVVVYRMINLWLPMVPALAGLPALRRLGRGSLAQAG